MFIRDIKASTDVNVGGGASGASESRYEQYAYVQLKYAMSFDLTAF